MDTNRKLALFDDISEKFQSLRYECIESWNYYMIEYTKQVKKHTDLIWMSESGGYGAGDYAVMTLSYDIIRHLNYIEASSWIYWQVLDQSVNWALIITNTRYPWWLSKWNYNPTKTIAFYVMMQFSQHIRPGYRIISNSKAKIVQECFGKCFYLSSK